MIAANQYEIDSIFKWLETTREKIPAMLRDAQVAIDRRDALFKRIEDEKLWAVGGDYESIEDYMDAKGFSRQRSKQLRDRARVAELVNTVDAMLPIPTDAHARVLTTLRDNTQIVRVWKAATSTSGYPGNMPPVTYTKLLVEAAQSGVNVENADALALFKEQQATDEIRRLFLSLSIESKERVLNALHELATSGRDRRPDRNRERA